jgi:hypothetical protein
VFLRINLRRPDCEPAPVTKTAVNDDSCNTWRYCWSCSPPDTM